jgi:hypothetical protein
MRRQGLDMQQVDVATSLYEQGWDEGLRRVRDYRSRP